MTLSETIQDRFKLSFGRFETWLTDEEWAFVELLHPPPSKEKCPRGTGVRNVLNTIRRMSGTERRRRAFLRCFLSFTTIQNYLYRWSSNGVHDRMVDALTRALAKDHERHQ